MPFILRKFCSSSCCYIFSFFLLSYSFILLLIVIFRLQVFIINQEVFQGDFPLSISLLLIICNVLLRTLSINFRVESRRIWSLFIHELEIHFRLGIRAVSINCSHHLFNLIRRGYPNFFNFFDWFNKARIWHNFRLWRWFWRRWIFLLQIYHVGQMLTGNELCCRKFTQKSHFIRILASYFLNHFTFSCLLFVIIFRLILVNNLDGIFWFWYKIGSRVLIEIPIKF